MRGKVIMLTDVVLDTKREFMSRPASRQFVIGGNNVHMPRHEFLALLRFNGWQCCHICLRKSYLVVDHDHRSMLIRGLLCDTCNRLVGVYESGRAIPNIIKVKIVAYLANTPCNQLGMQYKYQEYYPGQNEGAAS